jgi:hypothetical protein
VYYPYGRSHALILQAVARIAFMRLTEGGMHFACSYSLLMGQPA